MSPGTGSIPRFFSAAAASSERASPITSWPFSSSLVDTEPPI